MDYEPVDFKFDKEGLPFIKFVVSYMNIKNSI